MRTYEEGYKWGTALCSRVETGEVSPKIIAMIVEAKGSGDPYMQGKIDSCFDWLHKERLLNEEIARREKGDPPKGKARHFETAH